MPNPGTCEYVTGCGKRDFADGMKVVERGGEIILGYPGGPCLITGVPQRGCAQKERSEDRRGVGEMQGCWL